MFIDIDHSEHNEIFDGAFIVYGRHDPPPDKADNVVNPV